MFSHCSGLTSLNLKGLDTSHVFSMMGMFSSCSSLKTLDLSTFKISPYIINMNMFDNCTNLAQIKIPVMPVSTYLPGYYGRDAYIWKNSQGKVCTEIEESDIPTIYTRYLATENNKSNQDMSGDGNMSVSKGTILTIASNQAQFKVTSSDAKNPTVEYKALTKAGKKKKTISIPEYISYKGVKYRVTSVASKCFKNNKKLTNVKISSSITKIGNSAFEGCTNLKTATIGKGLKTIGKNAFKNCKSLKKLTLKGTKLKSVGKTALKGVNAKCRIKVPAKKVKAYKKVFKGKGQKASVKITK